MIFFPFFLDLEHLSPKPFKIKETEFFTRISYFKRGADLGIPYAPFNYWAPFKKDAILFTDGLDNALLIINRSGKVIGKVETELPEVPMITDKDITKWCIDIKKQMSQTQSDKEWYRKFGKVIEEYKDPVYKKKPYIQSLQVTGEGNIFISAITEPGTDNRDFWLLSPEGKILSHNNLDIFESYIYPHYIFVKKKDAEGNMSVWHFKRCGDEISDFKALVDRLTKKNAAVGE